ncbi:MAG: fibronectin type III-like domain-contianing protein [Lachnospiraceae bacterium]|nr:fibronectin type III-like domain-contianing protein [Lachnospiraceae bacterium]
MLRDRQVISSIEKEGWKLKLVKRNKTKFWFLWMLLFVSVLIVALIVTYYAFTYQGALNSVLGIDATRVEGLSELTASDYSFTKEGEEQLIEDDHALYQKIVEEGTTLVKNDSGTDGEPALPLKEDTKVSIFGIAAPAYLDLKDSLEQNGIQVNSTLYEGYQNFYAGEYQPRTGADAREVPWDEVSKVLGDDIGDTALVVPGRRSSEGTDCISGHSGNNMANAYDESLDYLSFTENERELLIAIKALKDEGIFKRTIVLITTSNSIDSAFINDPECGVDALVWTSADIDDTDAVKGIANLLTSKDGLDFSGRLVDTMYVDNQLLPEMSNFGYVTADLSQVDDEVLREVKEEQAEWRGAQGDYWNTSVTYQEGIYYSYRYYETRYEDYILNGNDNNAYVGWSYDSYVAEPFGKGLHYNTEISYGDFSVAVNDENNTFDVSMTIINGGSTDVLHSVTLYMQTPYSERDKENGIEESSIKLVAYDKFEIPANSSIKVTIPVDQKEMRSYDAYVSKTYIRDGGDYYITVGEDVHDAMNNILALKTVDMSEALQRMDELGESGNADLVWKTTYEFDDKVFATSDAAGESFAITNQFDHVDLNQDEDAQAAGNNVVYLSRTDWVGTFPMTYYQVKYNNEMVKQAAPQVYETDETLNAQMNMPVTGADNGLTVIDLMGEPFDSEVWTDFIEQLTIDELVDNVTYGQDVGRAIERLGVPATKDSNGPSGYGGAVANSEEETISFTGGDLRAATFNDNLLEEMGRLTAENMYHRDGSDKLINLWGWGLDIHRTPYGGRNSQYYSEDAFLSGMVSAAETRGLQEKGAYAMSKHFLLNDQETNRHGISTWANEQTIREVYLPAFEYAAEKGGLVSVMTSFNRLGMVWAGQDYNALINVLRNEFGMWGSFITDMYEADYMDGVDGVVYGTTKFLASSPSNIVDPIMELVDAGDKLLISQLQDSAKRNLYQVVNSFALDGFTEDTVIRTLTPWWQRALLAVIIGCSIGAVASAGMLARTIVRKKRLKQNRPKVTAK